MPELTVHPLAAIFPMLAEDELADLAEDIKANGLREPIKLDASGTVLIDGRNRLAACEIAGVAPQFERLNGEDVAAYIVSVNLARRHLTKGQQAIALAVIYPEPERGRGKIDAGKKAAESATFSARLLRTAREIVSYPDLRDAVLAGTMKFDPALIEAQKRTANKDSDEAHLVTLRAAAPDIAHLVDEDELTISEAWGAFERRQQDAATAEANKRSTLLRLSEAAYRGISAWASENFATEVTDRLSDPEFRAELRQRLRFEDPDSAIDEIAAGAERLSEAISIMLGEEE